MSRAHLPIAIPSEITAITTDAPPNLLGDAFQAASERFDAFIGAVVTELAKELDLPDGVALTTETLIADRGWSDDGALALRWLLETLGTYGRAEASAGSWTLVAAENTPRAAAELRAEAVAAMPATEPTYRVFELCAAAFCSVLSGESRGEDALFSPATLGLWFEYFSNDNPHYALNNVLAAAALRLAVGHGAHLLEVGGGGGSAALAALAALVEADLAPASYSFTELHPAFLRRGSRAVQAAIPPGCTLSTMRFDIDGDPAAQGVVERDLDAVFAVNTLHLARDLVSSLSRLRSLLRPGGALVLGELIRPHPTAGVHIELPFTLLEAYRCTPLIDGIRPRPGFVSVDGWKRALSAAGFSRVTLLPAAYQRCVDLYPGFLCCALTATV